MGRMMRSSVAAAVKPVPIGRRCGVTREMSPNSIVEVVRALDHEVLVVLVEGHREPIEEAVRSQHALKRHLKLPADDERDARRPGEAGYCGKRELDVLELHSPVAAQNPDLPVLSPGVIEANTDSVASTSIEEGHWSTGVDQRPHGPVAGVVELQPDIKRGPQDCRVPLLAVCKEVINACQPTPITMSSVRCGTNCATAPLPAGPISRTFGTRSREFSAAAITRPSLTATHRPAHLSIPSGFRSGSIGRRPLARMDAA